MVGRTNGLSLIRYPPALLKPTATVPSEQHTPIVKPYHATGARGHPSSYSAPAIALDAEFAFDHVSRACQEELQILGIERLEVPERIPYLTLAEAVQILRERYDKTDPDGDLDPHGEELICRYAAEELGSEFVFITHYPTEHRPMYAMPCSENPELTNSFDLLYRGIEITTGGQRIHDYDQLASSIRSRGLDPSAFDFYLEIFKYGMPPHGGLAIEAERLTVQVLGLSNVRQVSFFPRDRTRLVP